MLKVSLGELLENWAEKNHKSKQLELLKKGDQDVYHHT